MPYNLDIVESIQSYWYYLNLRVSDILVISAIQYEINILYVYVI